MNEHESDHPTNRRKLLTRLKRAEGQVAAVRRMLEEDAYCVDILTQIAAARGALEKVGHLVLSDHLEHCVQSALRSDDPEARQEKLDELMDLFERFGGLQGR